MNKSLTIGISGASGAIYGIRLLEVLREMGIQTHLIVTKNAHLTIASETNYTLEGVYKLAGTVHPAQDMAACISSGSYPSLGMVVAPCSMRSLAEIATGCTTTLVSRAADVTLKERRKLILLTRETPLNLSHLRNMATVTEMGGIIAPPVPAFYTRPETMDDIINHTVGRVLDLLDLPTDLVKRWVGMKPTHKTHKEEK
jgi:4-hydroxy-3-polyprenylbenzoate decarboxylase